MKDVERRVREWHDERFTGLGPTGEAIREHVVQHWWDVHTLIEELDRTREELKNAKHYRDKFHDLLVSSNRSATRRGEQRDELQLEVDRLTTEVGRLRKINQVLETRLLQAGVDTDRLTAPIRDEIADAISEAYRGAGNTTQWISAAADAVTTLLSRVDGRITR